MEVSLNYPKNILGMAELLTSADEDIDDLDAIERRIVGNEVRQRNEVDDDYQATVTKLARAAGFEHIEESEIEETPFAPSMASAERPVMQRVPLFDKRQSVVIPDEDGDDLGGMGVSGAGIGAGASIGAGIGAHAGIGAGMGAGMGAYTRRLEPEDPSLNFLTTEARKQSHVNSVMGDIGIDEEEREFIMEQDEDEEIAKELENIDMLRTNLENADVDVKNIPQVNANSSKTERKTVLRILQLKNDRLSYVAMFDQIVLSLAYGLENLFDGERDWFGHKPDLVGWSDVVKVKLNRMSHSTSSFVSEVMKDYSISPGLRIAIELLPSLFLHSRNRKVRSTEDTLVSDSRYRDEIAKLDK